MLEIAINTRCLIKGYYFFSYSGAMKVFLSMLCLLYAVEGYTFANKTKLHKDLFTNYGKKFRPGENQAIPTELNFSFHLRSIKELQESNGVMGVVGSLGVEWKDVRLAWNPLDYGDDLNQTSVFVEDIWAPYMVLMNPYEEIRPILSGGFSCEIWFNGDVSCLPPPNIFEALCVADVKFYPFDFKTCTIQLYVSGYYSSDLKFPSNSSTFNLERYVDNGPWDITNTLISVKSQHSKNKRVEILQLKANMQRRSAFHVLNLTPIVVLSGLQILVFLLPNESGERIGFSTTILLAVVVFLTMIQEKIPEDGNSGVSYLVYKHNLDMALSVFMVVAVVISSYCFNNIDIAKPEELEKTVEENLGIRKKRRNVKIFDFRCALVFFFLWLTNNLFFYLDIGKRHEV